MIPGVAGWGGVSFLLHLQQTGWLAKQTDGSIIGEVQDPKYDRMMCSNAFMATDVRTTGLMSLRQVIFEDFGTGVRNCIFVLFNLCVHVHTC